MRNIGVLPIFAWQVGGKAKVCLDLRWLALQASVA